MKLRQKLMILGSIPCILFLLISYIYIVPNISKNIYNQNDNQLKEETEIVFSIVNHYHNLEQKGNLSREEAQRKAKDVVRGIQFGESGYFWIDNTDFENVMHPIKPTLQGKSRINEQDVKGNYFVKEYIERAIENKDEGYYLDFWFTKQGESEASPKRGYTNYFEPWNWIIGTGTYIDDLQGQIQNTKIITLFLIIGVVILTIVLTFLISKHAIIKPLKKVTDKLDDIAQNGGDLTQRINYVSKDEVGQLSKSFDIFMERLQTIMKEVSNSTKVVSATSENLSISTSETAYSIEAVSKTVDEMAMGATQQAANAQEGTKRLENLSDGIDKLVRSAEIMKGHTRKSSEANIEGKQRINELTVMVEENTTMARKVGKQVEVLADKSSVINNIINTIESISKQTNLLALNAAIESARAGEAGKGFGVVAEEIRKLSEETSNSTKEIENIIREIQTEINNTNTQINEVEEMIGITYKISQETSNAFEAIDESIKQTVKQIEKFMQHIDKVDKEKKGTITVVEGIAAITEDAAASTEEVSASVQQQSVIIEEIADTADNLTTVSEKLTELINQFII